MNTLNIANSAIIVLPEPVGAPINILSSVLYRPKKTYVYIGLKYLYYEYNYSNWVLFNALIGKGYKSNNSVKSI